jgi:hypothetical protein
VLDGERLALVVPDDERAATGDVGERQVRGVAGVRRREHVGRARKHPRDLEQRVDRDTRERDTELRPGGHTVDVAGEGRGLERMDLVPAPRRGTLDETLDRERPGRGVEARRDLSGQHRPVLPRVVLTGWEPFVSCPATAGEPSGESRHDNRLPHFISLHSSTAPASRTAHAPAHRTRHNGPREPGRESPTDSPR